MEIEIICDTTQFESQKISDKNLFTTFIITPKALIISFCDENQNVYEQSEIEISDARKLAKLILND
ncbi:MAG: hypothetical protein K9G64_09055 [Bacteroidia bacterium]|jgi:hypothetical protein|nr:hypothetical protein [Bacteroidia bacterium]